MSTGASSEDDTCLRKVCRVCGDKANGYNYNVVTCESCKAFFRRNANKPLVCPRQSNCGIAVHSRRACPKCRLDKCFNVGMLLSGNHTRRFKNKHQLSSPEEKSTNGALVERLLSAPTSFNSRPRGSIALQMYSYCQCHCECKGHDRHLLSDIVENALQCKLIDHVSPMMGSGSTDLDEPPISPPMYIPFFDDRVDTQFPLAVESTHCPPLSTSTSDDHNTSMLAELRAAGDCMMSALTDDELALTQSYSDVEKESNNVYFIKLMDKVIRRMIEMAKSISAFRQLSQDDQTVLLKGSVMEIFILHGAQTFDGEMATWKCRNDPRFVSLNTTVLKQFAGHLYDKYMSFMSTFDPTLIEDEILMYILIAITLFKPRHAHYNNTEHITQQYNAYKDLLRSYVFQRQPTRAQGIYVYNALMNKLDQMSTMNIETLNFFIALGFEEIGPLLVEIFDLK